MVRFYDFDLGTRFAPQPRALFQGLSFQNRSDTVILTFWLRNVLRTTAACTFLNISTSKRAKTLRWFFHFEIEMRIAFWTAKFPKVLSRWGVCNMLTNLFRTTTLCQNAWQIYDDLCFCVCKNNFVFFKLYGAYIMHIIWIDVMFVRKAWHDLVLENQPTFAARMSQSGENLAQKK